MTPLNYLCRAAKHAKATGANYVVAARDGKTVYQGPNLQAAKNLDGATLYFFCEPSLGDLMLAASAGVQAVYYGVSKRDAVRAGLYPDHLKPQNIRYCRDKIVAEYLANWNSPV